MEKRKFVKKIEAFMRNNQNPGNFSKETCIFIENMYNKFSSLTENI